MENEEKNPRDLFDKVTAAANEAYASWRAECPDYDFPPVKVLSDLEYQLFGICTGIVRYREGKNDLTFERLCDEVLSLYGYAMTERR